MDDPGATDVVDLAAMLHDADPDVRERAAAELSDRYRLYADDAVVEGLVAAARADGPTAEGVVALLTEMRDDRAVPGLLALAEDPAAGTREAAVEALGPVPGRTVDDVLAARADDSDPGVRVSALRAIRSRGHDRARNVFLDALEDPHREVVEAGLSGLTSYRDSGRVLDAIATVARDTDRPVRLRNVAARTHPDMEPTASRIPVVGPRIRRFLG